MINSIFNSFNFAPKTVIQDSYITSSINIGVELDENTFKQYLSSIGICDIKVKTTKFNDNGEYIYKIVEIDLKNVVINSDKSHIDILSDIEIIAKQIFGSNVEVIIYE